MKHCLSAFLASCLWLTPGLAQDPGLGIDLSHLQRLEELVEVGGAPCRIVWIYCEAPEYAVLGDDDEGISCVDDVARAARLYLRRYRRTGDRALLKPAAEMLRFVLALQADDGEFLNFVWPDHSINVEHENSRKAFAWWMARGFRALVEGVGPFREVDPELSEALEQGVRRTLGRLRSVRLGEGQEVEVGQDLCANVALALLTWRETTGEEGVDPLIESFVGQIAAAVWPGDEHLPYRIHKSWRDTWHAWGHLQVEALARAGAALERPEWIAAAREEADGFHRHQLAGARIAGLTFTESGAEVTAWPQIAYDASCLVQSQRALYDVTGEEDYALMAGLAASWFAGNNPGGGPMYDEASGRGLDGIRAQGEINRNAGAESTIEALLALEAIADLPLARTTYRARRVPGGDATEARFRCGERLLTLRRGDRTWSVTLSESKK